MPNSKRFLALFSGDIAAYVLLLYVTFSAFYYANPEYSSVIEMLNTQSFIILFCSLMASFFLEIYDGRKNYGSRQLISRVGAMTAITGILLLALYSFDQLSDRKFTIYALTLCFFSLFHIIWHGINHGFIASKAFGKRVVILGDGDLAQRIGEIVGRANSPYDFLGYVSCGNTVAVKPDRVVGGAESLAQIVKNKRADAVVVSMRERRGVFPAKDLLDCKMSGIEIYDAPAFYEKITGKLLVENITPSGLIFSDGFHITPIKLVLKRILDVFAALLLLVVILPFIPLIALILLLDSPGPLLFSQYRMGEQGTTFKLYKFRTMCRNAEQFTGAVWSQKGDPRITRVGRIYRKLRIDEIPQLWNILRGDMSFVGPRPERPEFVEGLAKEIPYYSGRHAVKPGLTGWAQVSYPYGSSVEDAKEKLRYDMYYIKNYSLLFDLFIILKTVKVILKGAGR